MNPQSRSDFHPIATHPGQQDQLVLLRRNAVEAMTGLSRSSIYDLGAQGEFPKPIPLGPKCVRWLQHEVQDWIRQKLALRK